MRFLKGSVIGAAALGLIGLVGCDASAGPHPGGTSPTAGSRIVTPGAMSGTAPPLKPVPSRMRARAHEVATQFYGLYSASQFAASWKLLSPFAKRQVPENVWVGVHRACPAVGAGRSRVIKTVTVFGDAAIITETLDRPGTRGAGAKPVTAEDVFEYANGRWSYSPTDLGVYDHGSVAADVIAARAAGFCAGSKIF